MPVPLPDKPISSASMSPRNDWPYCGVGVGVGRGRITEHYIDPPAVPYENGAFVMSLLPYGQKASYVFLEEDQEYLYGVVGCVEKDDAVFNARAFRHENKNSELLKG